MMFDNDQDLRDRFSALRREVEAGAPPISLPRLTEHRRRPFGKLAAAATFCLATMIAVAVWLLPVLRVPNAGLGHQREHAAASTNTASITSWKPATDFLLDTPGRELLRDVPTLGDSAHATIAPDSGQSRRHLRKQVLP